MHQISNFHTLETIAQTSNPRRSSIDASKHSRLRSNIGLYSRDFPNELNQTVSQQQFIIANLPNLDRSASKESHNTQ